MIELSLTIEIYIAGVKNRAGFATDLKKGMPNFFAASTGEIDTRT